MAKKKATKSTKAEINLRVSEVRGWLLVGYSRAEIVHNGSEKWKITERQVDTYIKKAKQQIDEYVVMDREQAMQRMIQRLEHLASSLFGEDARVYLATLQEMSKLMGLYQDNRLVLEISPETQAMMDALGVSKQQLNVAIANILAKQIDEQPTVH